MGSSTVNVQNFVILFFVYLLPMSKTMETYSILKPCVNCDELHVKLGQNLPLQPQVSGVLSNIFVFAVLRKIKLNLLYRQTYS